MQALDWIVVGFYLLLVALIGFLNGRGQRSTKDYFLGGRRIPWWAAGLSILATETSALTFIGGPEQSIRGDWTYLQLTLGSILGRFLVAGLLLGAYYKAEVFTVYGWLGMRFGPWTKIAGSLLFFLGRTLGSGVRLFGAAIALVVVLGIPFPLAIGLIALVALAYTTVGGIRSVVWTDTVQGLLLLLGGGAALICLVSGLEGGLKEALADLGTEKLRVLNTGVELEPFRIRFDEAYTLIGGIFGACFLTLSTHGTDQDMIQRALSCRGAREGRWSLWLSAALTPIVVVIFLSVGSLLWVHYGGEEGVRRVALELGNRQGRTEPDYPMVFPFYVVSELPAGVKGLILVGLFAAAMSSLDSAMASLSSTAVKCLWEPWVQPGRSEAHYLGVSRLFSIFFGLVLVGIALLVWKLEVRGGIKGGFGVLMLGLKVLSWFFPPLLGIFLLGALTRRGRDQGNLLGLLVGLTFLLVVEFWDPLFRPGGGGEELDPPFAWIWNSMFGCLLSFGIGACFPPPPGRRAHG